MAAIPRHIASAKAAQKTALPSLRGVTVVAERCLLRHRLAKGVFAEPFASNGCLS
jgi:hypothetical protein